MKRILGLLVFAFTWSTSVHGQGLTGDQVDALRKLESALSLDSSEVKPDQIQKQSGKPWTTINDGKRTAFIMDGTPPFVSGWADMATRTEDEDFTAPAFLPGDNELWAWAETRMKALLDVESLARKRLRRQDGALRGSAPPSIVFEWEREYNGYQSTGGEFASIRVRKRDGRALEVWISSKRIAEEPNIKISESEALELAAKATGWERSGLTATLRYVPLGAFRLASPPPRLVLSYSINSPRGSVEVEASTGTVSTPSTPGMISKPGIQPARSKANSNAPKAGQLPRSLPKEDDANGTWPFWVLGGLVVASAAAGLGYRLRRQ